MTDEEAAKIKKMLDEWDASGAIKTSLYYRLLSSILTTKKPIRKEAAR
jgi:hypothetical protein